MRKSVVICNFNKREYVLGCIESVLSQGIAELEIYVVDNASSDGSAAAIKERYADRVEVIANKKNLGGSGGFNVGIKRAMDMGNDYIVLLDNDVKLEENCLNVLFESMDTDRTIGIMGCRIMKMDYPDVIQEFAPVINYETLTFELCHGGERYHGQLKNLEECDYVPACALIVRREVVEKIGVMPEENFIYYDDITWCTRCREIGYKVVANANAVAFHKGGAAINPTTFSNYYILRNKIAFFTTYLNGNVDDLNHYSMNEIENRADAILRDVFEGIYTCYYRGEKSISATRMDAFIDALNNVNGKAENYKIRVRDKCPDRIEQLIKKYNNIAIYVNGYYEAARKIVNYIKNLIKTNELSTKIILFDNSNVGGEILGISIVGKIPDDFAGICLQVCRHIYEEDIVDGTFYIDGWNNLLLTDKDFEERAQYHESYRLFSLCFRDRLINLIVSKGNVVNE